MHYGMVLAAGIARSCLGDETDRTILVTGGAGYIGSHNCLGPDLREGDKKSRSTQA